MKRTTYKGYVIDRDDLGRIYVYNTKSPYSEESDHVLIPENTVKAAKEYISAEVWKHTPSKCYTICYALYDEKKDPEDFWTATWFSYGRNKEDAKDKFLRDFHSHPEDFYGATQETQITICNVIEGFSC